MTTSFGMPIQYSSVIGTATTVFCNGSVATFSAPAATAAYSSATDLFIHEGFSGSVNSSGAVGEFTRRTDAEWHMTGILFRRTCPSAVELRLGEDFPSHRMTAGVADPAGGTADDGNGNHGSTPLKKRIESKIMKGIRARYKGNEERSRTYENRYMTLFRHLWRNMGRFRGLCAKDSDYVSGAFVGYFGGDVLARRLARLLPRLIHGDIGPIDREIALLELYESMTSDEFVAQNGPAAGQTMIDVSLRVLLPRIVEISEGDIPLPVSDGKKTDRRNGWNLTPEKTIIKYLPVWLDKIRPMFEKIDRDYHPAGDFLPAEQFKDVSVENRAKYRDMAAQVKKYLDLLSAMAPLGQSRIIRRIIGGDGWNITALKRVVGGLNLATAAEKSFAYRIRSDEHGRYYVVKEELTRKRRPSVSSRLL